MATSWVLYFCKVFAFTLVWHCLRFARIAPAVCEVSTCVWLSFIAGVFAVLSLGTLQSHVKFWANAMRIFSACRPVPRVSTHTHGYDLELCCCCLRLLALFASGSTSATWQAAANGPHGVSYAMRLCLPKPRE